MAFSVHNQHVNIDSLWNDQSLDNRNDRNIHMKRLRLRRTMPVSLVLSIVVDDGDSYTPPQLSRQAAYNERIIAIITWYEIHRSNHRLYSMQSSNPCYFQFSFIIGKVIDSLCNFFFAMTESRLNIIIPCVVQHEVSKYTAIKTVEH